MITKPITEENLFHFQKAIKIAELTLKYYGCVRNHNIIGALNILIQSRQIMVTCFIPGNQVNNSFDKLWIHRATNQIKINLSWIKESN